MGVFLRFLEHSFGGGFGSLRWECLRRSGELFEDRVAFVSNRGYAFRSTCELSSAKGMKIRHCGTYKFQKKAIVRFVFGCGLCVFSFFCSFSTRFLNEI